MLYVGTNFPVRKHSDIPILHSISDPSSINIPTFAPPSDPRKSLHPLKYFLRNSNNVVSSISFASAILTYGRIGPPPTPEAIKWQVYQCRHEHCHHRDSDSDY